MSHNLAVLNILPVNKTVVFYSPLEGKDVLVRTGTISEGSCFFHAILHSYSNNYVTMNIEGRMKFVKRLRQSISQKVDKLNWNLSGKQDSNFKKMLILFYLIFINILLTKKHINQNGL